HPDKCTKAESQLILLATDGELYGHHKRGREQFVAHLLQKSAPAYGFSVCSLERYLQAHPATKEVRLRAPSAWSCFHGVDRWKTDCPCTDGDGSWKYFLRQALCNLQEVADRLFTDDGSRVLHDPWVARDSYLALRNRWIEPSHFWKHHAAPHHRDVSSIYMAQSLLESQYWLQAAFTSCGFFFEDLDRIEPRNTIAFARRAISFVWQATGHDLQCDFLADLELVRSWRTGRTGTDLYRSLPAVPESLLPTEKQSVR
ncbi:MAG: DUF3536 domain-containing protein, partial [Chloroflexi bacterium]